jgi:hypothetical protein
MQWHRISILINQLKDDLEKQHYTTVDSNFSKLSDQNSIVRTNCIDCLDRTNVVQSILARRSLEIQLKEIGVLMQGETIENIPEFYRAFRHSNIY